MSVYMWLQKAYPVREAGIRIGRIGIIWPQVLYTYVFCVQESLIFATAESN